ncbi:MAG: arylsulfatase, partial [Alphaproteobacteria bacterium]
MRVFRILAAFLTGLSFVIAAEPQRPHIILIMSDDQGGWDYGFLGNPVVRTPNIDRMARLGAHLSRFYVSPVCTPTRANLMTGRYNYRTRAIDTYLGRAMMEPEEVTIAEVLGAAGYATGIFGKWHLGDCYPMRPQDQGFDEVLVHRGGGIGQPSDPPGAEGKYTDPVLQHNGVEKAFKGYCTDIYFDHAIRFLRRQHRAGKPVFMYLPTNAPHGPFDDVPEELRRYYAGLDLRGAFPKEFPERQFKRHEDRTARIFAMEENIDENVGKLFAELKRMGAYENTLVFYLNDNGPNGPRRVGPHRGAKGTIYEGGIRSPLLAVWPKQIPAGTKSDLLSAHYDVFPTILEAAGVEKPAGVKLDGVSLLPALRGQRVERTDRGIFLQWHRGDYPVPYRNGAIITERYKLLWPNYGGEIPPKNHGPELYDLKADPKETRNLASSHPEIFKRLKRRYD